MSAGLLLLLSSAAKVASVLGEASFLGRPDVFLDFLTMRQLLFAAGCLEVAIAYVAMQPGNSEKAPWLVAWFCTLIILYRLGLWSHGSSAPCYCLGHFPDVFGMSADLADWLMKLVLVYLAAVSYSIIILEKYKSRGQ